MNTVIYALMHFFVDFICAWAMFGSLRDGGYETFLVYNFCAFALQPPLGTLLDLLHQGAKDGKKKYLPLLWAAAGVLLTAVGAVLHPAVLGLGNALFHVGGGMDVIQEDFAAHRKGRDLGIFVAPGAIGLFLGTQMGKSGFGAAALICAAVALSVMTGCLFFFKRGRETGVAVSAVKSGRNVRLLGLCCFAVVILRSWVGLSVSFSWKTGSIYPWLAVIAVALGKVAGGLLSARFGAFRTVTYSLLLSAVCFLLGDAPLFGLAALFLFNISMPVTLYLLAGHLSRLPGFAFGLLTFGLFLGFLPVYAGMELPWSGTVLGAIGSILSALLLTLAGRAVGYERVSS